jgi:phospholipase C
MGHQDQANHQYDLKDFFAAADQGNLPAVAYLKAPRAQDGHAGYSDPLSEQTFLTDTVNQLQKLPSWKSTAVVVSYDGSTAGTTTRWGRSSPCPRRRSTR